MPDLRSAIVLPAQNLHSSLLQWRRRCFLLVALFCLHAISGTLALQAQDTAFLLGYQYSESISSPLPYYSGNADSLIRPAYHTLLFTNTNGKVALAGETPGLLVPRANGFWRVDTKRSIYNNWVEDFIWSAPQGVAPELPGIQAYNGENCEGHRTQKINFAGLDYLAVEVRTAGYCEDAAHPWHFNTFAVIPIDSTAHLGVPISKLLGVDGSNALQAAAARFQEGLSVEQRELFLPIPDEASWNLARHEGRWILKGRLDPNSVNFGSPADFNVDAQLPLSLVGHNHLVPDWKTIKAYAPDAIDAFSAPGADMLLILHSDSITTHLLSGGQIGPATLTVDVPKSTSVVMTRWAVGTEANQWLAPFARVSTPAVTQSR